MSVLDLEFSKNHPYKDHSPLVAQQILNNLETNDGINKIYSEIKEILKKYIWDRAKLNEFYGALEEAFYNDKEEINLKLFFEDEISQFIDDEKKQKEFMGEIINIFKKNKLIPFIAQEKSNWPRVIYKNFSFKDLRCYYLLFPIYKLLDNKYFDEWLYVSEQEFTKVIQETLKNNWRILKKEQLLNDTELSSVIVTDQGIMAQDVVDYLLRIVRIFLWDLCYNWEIKTISDLYNIINTYC